MLVLASDFDHTLFFHEQGFKKEDIEAIRLFQQKGNLFGICSGRPLAGLLMELNGIIEPDFFIVSTGGAILDKNDHILYQKELPRGTALEIYNKYKHEVEFLAQTLSLDTVYATHIQDKHVQTITSLNEVQEPLYSLSLVESTVERARQITEEINHQYHEVDAYQNVNSIDVVACGCSKGQAIQRLKEVWNIQTIAAIGDSFNDLPMLQQVDIPFTFDTSPNKVKTQADYIVTHLSEAIDILVEGI